MLWRDARGHAGAAGGDPAAGRDDDHRGHLRPAGADRGGGKDLQALLGKHGFLPGVAGHASAGNLHFMLTPNFGEQPQIASATTRSSTGWWS